MSKVLSSFASVVLGVLVFASSPSVMALSASASVPLPLQVIKSAHSAIKVYDTNQLLHRKDMVITRVLTKRVNFGKGHHSTAPGISFGRNADLGYYDLGLNWVHNHQGVYICGYVVTDIESVTGPAHGGIQAELFINNGRGDDHEYWSISEYFDNSYADESPCYNVNPDVAIWTVEGGGTLTWADGFTDGTNNVAITRKENQ